MLTTLTVVVWACSTPAARPAPDQGPDSDDVVLLTGGILYTPAVALRDSEPVVVGHFMRNALDAPSTGASFRVLKGDSRISAPPGEFHFIRPRLVADAGGSVHMFWGEPEAPLHVGREYEASRVATLWYARLEDTVWSEPLQIAPDDSYAWLDGQVAVAASGDTLLHLAVRASNGWLGGRGPRAGLIVLARNGHGEWTSVPVTRGFVRSVDLEWSGATLYMAFVGQDVASGVDGLAIRTSEDGESWSSPILPFPEAPGEVRRAWLFATAGDRLHLVSQVEEDRTFDSRSSLRHAFIGPVPAAWSSPAEIGLPELVLSTEVARAEVGSVVAFVQMLGPDGLPHLTQATWHDGAWSLAPFGTPGATAMRLSSEGESGSTGILWSTITPDDGYRQSVRWRWLARGSQSR
jgi:hypothetical protein